MIDETELRAQVARIVELAKQVAAGGDNPDPSAQTAFVQKVNRLAGLPDGSDFLSANDSTASSTDNGIIPGT
jgi:hypothetical protein